MSLEHEQVCGESVESSFQEAGTSKRFAFMVVAALSVVFLASAFYTPAAVQPDGSYATLCGFKMITGLPCPGCGLTHSFCSLGQGDISSAFSFNALGPPLFLAAGGVWLRFVFVLIGRLRPVSAIDRVVTQRMLIRAFLIGFAVFGIGRIVYLVANGAPAFQHAPLTRLIERLAG